MLLRAGARMEAQLVFLRDEEESVSALLSDITDDWNINGLRRAAAHRGRGAATLTVKEYKLCF